MRIYTKTGDDGQTGLFGGARVDKDDARVETYGTVDELCASIGVAVASGLEASVAGLCQEIQNALFVAGAELACVPEKTAALKLKLIGETDVASLEAAIDRYSDRLPELAYFILPGGTGSAAHLHHARTICRRAERHLIHLSKRSPVSKSLIIYINRLSDLLFVLARYENQRAGVQDVPWSNR